METFNWETALKYMENGQAVKRTDWGYGYNARISLLDHNHADHFYMHQPYNRDSPSYLEGYGVTYADLKSDKWCLYVPKVTRGE